MDSSKMMKFIFVTLLLVFHACAQDLLTEITGSGDGTVSDPTTFNVSLIDDNGDISTAVPTMDNETTSEFVTLLKDIVTEGTTVAVTSTTTSDETTVPVDITTRVATTDPPTTVTTTESTTTEITTTTTTTTTTAKPTTTTTTTTTVRPTTKKSTTTVSTTTMAEKVQPKQTTAKVHQVPTTPFIPDDAGAYCKILDSDFSCDQDIFCYGEGEIDCTEDTELDSSETTFVDKISLSSSSEDYDYDAAVETIGTFPPSLIGGKSRQKDPELLYNMASLGTEMQEENSGKNESEEVSTLLTALLSITSTLPTTEEIITETTENRDTTVVMDAEIVVKVEEEPAATEKLTSISFAPSTLPTKISQEWEDLSNETLAEEMVLTNETTQGPFSTNESIISGNETELPTELAVDEVGTENPVIVRRKREDSDGALDSDSSSSSSSASSSFKVAALENSKKKMRVKMCRLSGNLVCSPSPTTLKCKGKTFCEAVKGTAGTSEKSTTQKGVETWAIAVIAICAIAAALTIALLIYLVFTSWKKLKVQPQNGVTTLNYVNSAQP